MKFHPAALARTTAERVLRLLPRPVLQTGIRYTHAPYEVSGVALARRVGATADAGDEVLLQYDAASRLWELPTTLARRGEHPARTVGRLLGDIGVDDVAVEPGDAHAVADVEHRTIHAVFAVATASATPERPNLRWRPIGEIEAVTDLTAKILTKHGIPATAAPGRAPGTTRTRLRRAWAAVLRNWTLAAGGVIENDNGDFMLVRNHNSQHSGPPGGLAKWREPAAATARREVAEEVGFDSAGKARATEQAAATVVDWTEFPSRTVDLPGGTTWDVPGGNTEIDPAAQEVRIYQRGRVAGSPDATPRGVKQAGWVPRRDVAGVVKPGTTHLYR